MSSPRAVLVAVGDELLSGEKTNGNGVLLGQELAGLGIPVRAQLVVADDAADIASAVLHAVTLAEVVVLCGGLGPTQDDLTREGLALAAGLPLERDPALEAELLSRLQRPGRRPPPAANLRQADLPRGARPLANPVGTAPGLAVQIGDRAVYALPGVPRELAAMWRESVLPDLSRRFPDRPVIVRHTVRTVGLWESAVAEAMAPEVARTGGNPRIAFLASGGQTRVVVTAAGPDRASAETLAAATVGYAREQLGEAVYDADSLEAEVIGLLVAGGATVACAESLTAGLVSARLAQVPGASVVLRGGVVAYATELKRELLGVPTEVLHRDGAVSATTAEAMARGVARRCAATFGLALTGVAGPEPQEGNPPGTVHLAVAGPGVLETAQLALPGDRAAVREHAATAALALLRRALLRGRAGGQGDPGDRTREAG